MNIGIIVALEGVLKDLEYAIDDAKTKDRDKIVESIQHTVDLIYEMIDLISESEEKRELISAGVSDKHPGADVNRLSWIERRRRAKQEKKALRE